MLVQTQNLFIFIIYERTFENNELKFENNEEKKRYKKYGNVFIYIMLQIYQEIISKIWATWNKIKTTIKG